MQYAEIVFRNVYGVDIRELRANVQRGFERSFRNRYVANRQRARTQLMQCPGFAGTVVYAARRCQRALQHLVPSIPSSG